jgi:MFS family permease
VQHTIGPESIVIEVKEGERNKAPSFSLQHHTSGESINAQVGAAIMGFQWRKLSSDAQHLATRGGLSMPDQIVRQSSSRAKPRLFYGYTVVVATFFIMMLMWGTISTFGVFFKPMLTDLGWTRAVTSGAFAVFWIIQGLLAIAMGGVNDRLGPRIVITVCGFILGLGFLLMSQTSALWQLYLFYGVIIATGMSGAFVPLTSTVSKWFVKRRSMMTGIVVSGIGVGQLIAPPLANWLISIYDWRISYIILGSMALVVVILVAQLLRRDPAQMGLMPYGESKEEIELKGSTMAFSLKEAASVRQLWLVLSMYFCLGFSMFTILVHIAPHATDLRFSATTAASILATAGCGGFIGRLVLGWVADRIGNRQVFIMGFVLMTAALFCLIPAAEAWMLYLLAAVIGFASGGCVMSESPLVAELFGLRSHGLILGVTSFGYCMGSAAGPFLAGYIFDVTGSYNVAFLVCAAVSVAGLILSAILTPTKTSQSM